MLRLDAVLPDLPDGVRPMLLSEVLREDGPDVSAHVGDTDRGEDDTYSIGEDMRPLPRSRHGISPSIWSVSALYRTYGVLGSVIFIRLSFWISVKARFSSSHCRLCDCDPGCCGTAFLRMPFGLGLEADRGKRGT